MLHIVLLLLPPVLSADWGVNYPGPDPICVARGSNVTIRCTFTYPSEVNKVQHVKWCSMNSNSGKCQTGPYVYNSEDNNIQNNFQYIGDQSSDCSLLISNIKIHDSGKYKFKFITDSETGIWTGDPGVNITVHDLRVSMSSSRGNGRIIVGDSVNLTCSLDCSAGLSDVQWFKNGRLTRESKPVLVLTKVTVKDSGKYCCSLRNVKNTASDELKIHIEGVFSADWTVNYLGPICAVRGSNIIINCTFTYPKEVKIQHVKWCSMNSNSDLCVTGPYVYDSEDNNIQNNFHYIGDKSSDCSLLISNIKLNDSGEYKFRFITDSETGKRTGDPGVNITVHDLRVSISSSRGNGRIIVGDSVNLTCSLDCSGLSDVQWFKKGRLMEESKPVLVFTNVTTEDSGNYYCSLRNVKTTASEEFRIHIEGLQGVCNCSVVRSICLITAVSSVTLVFIIEAVMFMKRKKTKTQGKPNDGEGTSDYAALQITAETQASSIYSNLHETMNKPQEDEV